MGGLQHSHWCLVIAAFATLVSVTGCAGSPDIGAKVSERDSLAYTYLAGIASRDAQPEGPVEEVECWAPSQNPVQGERGDAAEQSFRVICRVHFSEQGVARYRDMTCIGDLGRDPIAEYCYQSAYYADAAKFEDRPAYPAPIPRLTQSASD